MAELSKKEFHQSYLGPILGGGFSLFICLIILTSDPNGGKIILALMVPVSIILLIYFYISFKWYSFESDHLLIRDRYSAQKLLYQDILSMAVVNRNKQIVYQIKTVKKTFTLPIMSDSDQFEHQLLQKTDLELHQESKLPLSIGTPNLKRWRKSNEPYEYTGLSDRIDDLYFNFPTIFNSSFSRYFVAAVLVIVALIFAQNLYMNQFGH